MKNDKVFISLEAFLELRPKDITNALARRKNDGEDFSGFKQRIYREHNKYFPLERQHGPCRVIISTTETENLFCIVSKTQKAMSRHMKGWQTNPQRRWHWVFLADEWLSVSLLTIRFSLFNLHTLVEEWENGYSQFNPADIFGNLNPEKLSLRLDGLALPRVLQRAFKDMNIRTLSDLVSHRSCEFTLYKGMGPIKWSRFCKRVAELISQ